MIKSLAVAIDSTDSSQRAQIFALGLAKKFNASVTGIGVLDVPWIRRPMATPIGVGSYRAHRDETILSHHRDELDQKISSFDQRCGTEGVPHKTAEIEGSPAEVLGREAERHDLFVIGRDTNFHGVRGHDIGDATEQLLEDHPRPIIVVPRGEPLGGSGVLVAFDGSLPSSRSMHMLYLLGLTNDEPVHIVSVHEEAEQATALAARGAAFFRARGVEAEPHGIHEEEAIADVLMDAAESLKVGMLAMGAFGKHSFFHQLVSGSVTKQLIRACPVPIFVDY